MNFQSAFVMTPDPIYVKMLPGGEATPLVDDRRVKYGLSFSPDGSQIAYGVSAPSGYDTYAAATVKGEPRLLLANAAALSWLDAEHVLFAEIRRGMHLGIVAATRSRSEHRDVYFPQHERAMAHYAYASPDRRWALVVEMDERPVWQPCRLVPSPARRGDGRSGLPATARAPAGRPTARGCTSRRPSMSSTIYGGNDSPTARPNSCPSALSRRTASPSRPMARS